MPSIIEIRFTPIAHGQTEVTNRQTHAALMEAMDEPEEEHHGSTKPYSCWPLMDDPESPVGLVLRVGWLTDGPPPERLAHPIPKWRFGRLGARVTEVRVQTRSFAELSQGPDPSCVRFEFVSPTRFSRSGVHYPMPEPKLVLESLARRWNVYSPLPTSSEAVADCWKSVVITDFQLQSEAILVDIAGSGTGSPREVGAVGAVGVMELRARIRNAAHTLGALARFAQYSGVGHLTTQGFGACRTTPLGQWPVGLAGGTPDQARTRPGR